MQTAGSSEKTLTAGWEILGLEKSTAERIFKEESAKGFTSDTLYGGSLLKYDDKGKRLNENDMPHDKISRTKKELVGPMSNTYECSKCGYTIFVAAGKEDKFFGDGFQCPECGSPREKFIHPKDGDDA